MIMNTDEADYEVFASMVDDALRHVVDFPRGFGFQYKAANVAIDRLVARATETDVRKALKAALKSEVRQRTAQSRSYR